MLSCKPGDDGRVAHGFVETADNFAASIACRDVGDGSDLDLTVGGRTNKIYLNMDGLVQAQTGWNSAGKEVDGEIIVAIQALAETRGALAGCGALGRLVDFKVTSAAMSKILPRENDHTTEIALQPLPGSYPHLWLPLVVQR